MLAPRPETLSAEQHRLALTVVAAVALRTTGPDAEGFGDATFMGGGDLGIMLGISEWAARARLGHAVTLGALDRRSAAPTGVTSKLRIPRAPHELWAVTQQPGPAALVCGLEAGERTVLDALTHPAIDVLGVNAALSVMFAETDVDPLTRSFTRPALSRARSALDAVGVTDTRTLLAYLDAQLTVAGTDGITPAQRRAAAVAKRLEAANARAREIARYQIAGRAAARLDYAGAYAASRKVTPLVVAAVETYGRPGERGGDELRTWCATVHAHFAPHNLSPAETAGAVALLARACSGRGRTDQQNQRLAQLAVEGTPE